MRVLLTLTLTAACALACADFERGDRAPYVPPASDDSTGNGNGNGNGAVSFADAVHPLLVADCQQCHQSGGVAGNTNFEITGSVDEDYVRVLEFIDESAPASSRLLSKASGVGHGTGGAIYPTGSPERAEIIAWIEAGANP